MTELTLKAAFYLILKTKARIMLQSITAADTLKHIQCPNCPEVAAGN